jgi:hypothetical protein
VPGWVAELVNFLLEQGSFGKEHYHMKNLRVVGRSMLLSVVVWAVASAAQVNVTTWHNDIGRTGLNSNEGTLKTSNVSESMFGLLCAIPLSSVQTQTTPYSYQVYAQPLVVANSGGGMTTYAVSHGDFVYAGS